MRAPMSSDNRKSRQLSLNNDYVVENHEGSPRSAEAINSTVKKEDLKNLYRVEIDNLVAEQLSISKKLLLEEVAKKNEALVSEKFKKLNEKEKEYQEAIQSMEDLAGSLQATYQASVHKDIRGLDAIIVSVVMEALYKILGDSKSYKKSVIKTVGECLDNYQRNSAVKIRVSENDYSLLKAEFKNENSIKCLLADKRLNDGQCIFDDGASLYEAGLLDQLDSLRMIFMAKLRENHGI